ncbi:unnamed protein product [Chrysoparadoxa australica]
MGIKRESSPPLSLYRVVGKKSCLVSPQATSLTSESSFILIDYEGQDVYVWWGSDCQVIAKNLASSLGKQIVREEFRAWTGHFWEGLTLGAKFWQLLGVSSAPASFRTLDVKDLPVPPMKLLVRDQASGWQLKQEAQKFELSVLESEEVALFDFGSGELVLWLNKNVSTEKKCDAKDTALAYKREHQGIQLTIITQQNQPENCVMFYQRFSQFCVGKARALPDLTSTQKSIKDEIERMHNPSVGSLRMATDKTDYVTSHPLQVGYLKDESMAIKVWRVAAGGDFLQVPDSQVGLFTSEDAFAIRFSCKAGAFCTLFFWQGCDVSSAAKTFLAFKGPSLEPGATHSSVEQGREPPMMLLILAQLGRPMITMTGGWGDQVGVLEEAQVRAWTIRPGGLFSAEGCVVAAEDDMDTVAAYGLLPTLCYLVLEMVDGVCNLFTWEGSNAPKHLRVAAKTMASRVPLLMSSVEVTSDALVSDSIGATAIVGRAADASKRTTAPQAVAMVGEVGPWTAPSRCVRLFTVSAAAREQGSMFVREVGAGWVFKPSDLDVLESAILDAGRDKVYLCHGHKASEQTSALGKEVATAYVASLDGVAVVAVESGQEPVPFVEAFRTWAYPEVQSQRQKIKVKVTAGGTTGMFSSIDILDKPCRLSTGGRSSPSKEGSFSRDSVSVSPSRKKTLTRVGKTPVSLFSMNKKLICRHQLQVSSLRAGGAYLLIDTSTRDVFVWCGASCGIFNKNMAKQVGKKILNEELREFRGHFFCFDQDSPPTNAQDKEALSRFWAHLGSPNGSPASGISSLDASDVPAARLFSYSTETSSFSVLEAEGHQFDGSYLAPSKQPDKAYLLLCHGGESYAWIADSCSDGFRSAAKSAAIDQVDKLTTQDCGGLEGNLVVLEPCAASASTRSSILFDQRWRKFGFKSAEEVGMDLTSPTLAGEVETLSVEGEAKRMHSIEIGSLQMKYNDTDTAMSGHAMPMALLDDDSAEVKAWRIVDGPEGLAFEKISPVVVGVLSSSEAICLLYTAKNGARRLQYLWLGSTVGRTQKAFMSLQSKTLDLRADQVNLDQGQEPPYLQAALCRLGKPLVTLISKDATGASQGVRVLAVQESSLMPGKGVISATEQDLDTIIKHGLSPVASYIAFKSASGKMQVTMWQGPSTSEEVQTVTAGMASPKGRVATAIAGKEVVTAGAAPAQTSASATAFLELIGGQRSTLQTKELKPCLLPPRLFLVSATAFSVGAMFVREVGPGQVFRQQDLLPQESYLLDTGRQQVFLWHGPETKTKGRELGMQVAVAYIEEMPDASKSRRNLFRSEQEVLEVFSGEEPAQFIWSFKTWQLDLIPAFDHELAKQRESAAAEEAAPKKSWSPSIDRQTSSSSSMKDSPTSDSSGRDEMRRFNERRAKQLAGNEGSEVSPLSETGLPRAKMWQGSSFDRQSSVSSSNSGRDEMRRFNERRAKQSTGNEDPEVSPLSENGSPRAKMWQDSSFDRQSSVNSSNSGRDEMRRFNERRAKQSSEAASSRVEKPAESSSGQDQMRQFLERRRAKQAASQDGRDGTGAAANDDGHKENKPLATASLEKETAQACSKPKPGRLGALMSKFEKS